MAQTQMTQDSQHRRWTQMDILKILGDGTAEIRGKGRFYVFKKDAESALTKANPIPMESQR